VKIAVYAIAKNEANNLDGWFKYAKTADYVLLVDTGSTDGTVEKAKSLGINVAEIFLSPWDEARARNVAMSLLPKDIDYCVSVDLDEHISSPDWIDKIKEITYQSIYSYRSMSHNGSVEVIRPTRHIHPRFGYLWDGFRPRLRSYPGPDRPESSDLVLDFYTDSIAGNQERFDDRDPLYISSFKMYYEMLKEKSFGIDRSLYEAKAHLALSYFEIDDYESFLDLAWQIREESRSTINKYWDELGMLVDFAMCLLIPSESEDVLRFWKENYYDKKTVLYRKLLLDLVTKNKESLHSSYSDFLSLDHAEDPIGTVIVGGDERDEVLKIANRIVQGDDASLEDIRIIIEAYSSFGWGKKHLTLSKELAKKSWEL
jgi:glycosyltransferase involved in cell wall biosynthesis